MFKPIFYKLGAEIKLLRTIPRHNWSYLRLRRRGRQVVCLTSLAMVVMKAGGRAVAMRERACRAERAASAGGLRGRPMVTLQGNTTGKVLNEHLKKYSKFW